ncbi:HAMP domain-containing histidine kinase [Vibrio sp. S4M6]|uniref:sensor histidine kinase n=1 Tax=Vibrio sinus TaxID=2946865 RepID=UPI002029EDA4|nr:HAMP domain-containing sensor histidine kinase [Vibrio sinus]MCL9780267.1 HAMP domain-containing histidine kinase [Vibrio sinus]
MSSLSELSSGTIWRSSTFKYTLISSALFFVSALILLGIVGGAFLYKTNQADKQEQSEAFIWIAEEIDKKGISWLNEEFSLEASDLNDLSFWNSRIQNNQYAIYLDVNNQRYGYLPLAKATSGWSWQHIDISQTDEHGEIHIEHLNIRVLRRSFDSGGTLVIAANESYDYQSTRSAILSGLVWVCLTALPLSVLIAYQLSHKVYQRLDLLSDSLESIGALDLGERLPTSDKADEFDRLSMHINQMLARIEHLNTNIEDVTIGIAHDLKTPLTRLANQLQLIEMDPNNSGEHAEKAQHQVAAMLTTFNSLLRLSEIESGKRKAHFTPVDLSGLIDNLVESYKPVFEDHKLQLSSAIVPGISVAGDTELLNQMVINVFENNIKYTKINGRVWVHLQPSESGVMLQLGDDGPGIDAEHKERIFERFYTADASRSESSNGLGLSLVQSIAHLHNATINLLPEQKGAVFNIHFK